MTGLLGFESGYRAMEHCHALLMLGTDFPYRSFYPEDAKVVQVDIRGEHIGRRTGGSTQVKRAPMSDWPRMNSPAGSARRP